MPEFVQVNFGRPMPLFPLPDTVLLPHAVLPLHIFEPRYRQMIEDVLDAAGQIAMASFNDRDWKAHYHGTPPLRPAVCVGQIVQHEAMDDGRHNILLHGVCRARIKQMIEPDDERPYRMAKLAPLETVDKKPPPMISVRRDLRDLLKSPRLAKMRSVETVVQWFDRKDVTTHALLELIGFALLHDTETKYQLLQESSPVQRAKLIKRELRNLDHLVQAAEKQGYKSWPKGMSWN
ncbi:MAG TPA: LON peptidase substrate-binding domain-containing protein [Phycisphaerales bacterium]|nr:LON peptidase substrate-binding domain-containing protein [Phycisphaerales bacterium]